MMKNVYYLASTVEKTKFRLDIKYQSDTAGVYLTYIPDQRVKNRTLLKLLGCDRLDDNEKPHPNGYFDYVKGYTVSDGRVFLPSAEPFGGYLRKQLLNNGIPESEAEKYVFSELYDSTKTVARLIAEKDKYLLVGQYKGTSANVISLGAYNVPQGSVEVTAGGMKLTEGSDYTVDYSAGEVTILNQSIIDAGTNVSVSLESNTQYSMQRKTMVGVNWEYDFSKSFQIGGTLIVEQHTLGLERKLETGEAMAHFDAQQDTLPPREGAEPHFLYWRICPVDRRYGRWHSGQCLVYRRFRRYKDLPQCEGAEAVDPLECTHDVP